MAHFILFSTKLLTNFSREPHQFTVGARSAHSERLRLRNTVIKLNTVQTLIVLQLCQPAGGGVSHRQLLQPEHPALPPILHTVQTLIFLYICASLLEEECRTVSCSSQSTQLSRQYYTSRYRIIVNHFLFYYLGKYLPVPSSVFRIRIIFHADPDPGSQKCPYGSGSRPLIFYSDPDPRGVKIK